MRKFNLKIEQESYPESPREWDNLTTMICFHKRYNLGDKHEYESNYFNSYAELKEQLEKDHTILIIKPLYMYDHSGITISTSPFSCGFDSGQIGWVYVSKESAAYLGTPIDDIDKLDSYLESEVNTYDQYLRGDVYGYELYEEIEVIKKYPDGREVTDIEDEKLDSCWGYYGADHEASGLLDAVLESADNEEEKLLLTELVKNY